MRLSSGIKHILGWGLIGLLWASCTPYKHLPEGQTWVKDNEIVFTDSLKVDKRRGLRGDLLDLARPKATKGLKIGQWFYYSFAADTSKGINRTFFKPLRKPYTILDTSHVRQSSGNMEQLLFNKGFFNGTVTSEITHNEKNRSASLTYKVHREQLTMVREVTYEITDPRIKSLVLEKQDDSEVQPDQPFDGEHMVRERNRIADVLLNNGYYKFNKQYILFELDTVPGRKVLDVYVTILPPPGDSTFNIYYVGDIYLYPDHSEQLEQQEIDYDTLKIDGKYILVPDELKYTPQALLNNIDLKQGHPYSRQRYQTTLNRFTSLQVFRYVTIEIRERTDSTGRWLDFHIKLIPANQREINLSLNATTGSTYFLGSDVGVNYINKNLFKYTDIFNLGFSGGVEMQTDSSRNLFLNTMSLSGEATFSFPKFLAPFFTVALPKNANPRTDFVVRYEYFRRLGYYTQNNFHFTYGFDWNEFGFARHRLNAVEINYVRLTDTTSAFNASLERNPSLRKSFQNQLIFGSTYTYTKNTAHLDRKDLWVFRLNLDVAGNSLYALSLLTGNKNSEGRYTVFNQAFSQYVKPEGEARHYIRMRNNRQLILRLMGGVGVSYGNSEVMPYVKQYIVGGSNSLRGFRVRDLGPGSYRDTITGDAGSIFNDKSGDIKIEGNAEYRFPIISVIKGGVFLDVGNVWLLRADSNFTGGAFEWDRFYRDFAVNTGFGLRLDFTFFVMRFDLGFPLRDPRIEENNGWRFNRYFPFTPWRGPWLRQNVVFNLAIGYPF